MAFDLQVRQPSGLLFVQVEQVWWQFTATQFPLVSNWNPLKQEQVPSEFKKALFLQLMHPFELALLQFAHLLLQFWQFPFPSIKNPLLQTQLFEESLTAFCLHVRQSTFVAPKQVLQVKWQGTLAHWPVTVLSV